MSESSINGKAVQEDTQMGKESNSVGPRHSHSQKLIGLFAVFQRNKSGHFLQLYTKISNLAFLQIHNLILIFTLKLSCLVPPESLLLSPRHQNKSGPYLLLVFLLAHYTLGSTAQVRPIYGMIVRCYFQVRTSHCANTENHSEGNSHNQACY